MKPIYRAALSFSCQFATMVAVTYNVHQTVADRPLVVAAVQGIIGLAWVVNVGAIANGTWVTRTAYIIGGMIGSAVGTMLGSAR